MEAYTEMSHKWGAEFIESLQTSLPGRGRMFMQISDIGDPGLAFTLYFPVVVALHAGVGVRLMWSIIFCEWSNMILKWCIAGDRPYWWVHETPVYAHRRPPVLMQYPRTCETGPGMPSGHAKLNAAMFYILVSAFNEMVVKNTTLLSQKQRAWASRGLWASYAIWMMLVLVSRTYIAAHFPHQCVAGALIGLMMAMMVSRMPVLQHLSRRQYVALSVTIIVSVLGIYFRPVKPVSSLSSLTAMAQAPPKRQKTSSNASREEEFFPGISPIQYNPDAAPDESLVFRHYDAQQEVLGRTMEEWLRFSVAYWHSFRGTGSDPFGAGTIRRPWDDGTESLENAKRRLRAAFEFFSKLGNKYWTFHDRDLAPEGATIAETNANLDQLVELAAELQKKTGVKLLWATCNLFAHPRYMHGAATSCDAHVTAYAGAQVKKGLEVAHRLGAENFVFWGGREGYLSLLNTDVKADLDHLAAFFRMVIVYKEKIGFKGQLLIEPKAKEPTRHQYDYDAQTVMSFLHQYGLTQHFKLNIEPNHTTLAGHPHEHDVVFASAYGMLGSIDANTGSPDLGWDTDQFPMDVRNCTVIMKTVVEQGGLAPGGLNFDAKVRRESTELRDLFIAHAAAMDTFARGLKNAARIISDGVMRKSLMARYASWNSGVGARIAAGEASLEECEKVILERGDPKPSSGHQEHFEAMLNHYI